MTRCTFSFLFKNEGLIMQKRNLRFASNNILLMLSCIPPQICQKMILVKISMKRKLSDPMMNQ